MSGLFRLSTLLGAPRAGCLASALLFWLLLCPCFAAAQEITLGNLVLDNVEGIVKVRFGFEVRPSAALADILSEGAELGLSCRAQLGQRREYIWNQPVAKAEFIALLSREPGGTYQIRRNSTEEVLNGKDLDSLMHQAFGEVVMDLGSWKNLRRGENYTVYLEIRLGRQNVNPWLRKTLFFWSWDVAAPVRYQLDFSY